MVTGWSGSSTGPEPVEVGSVVPDELLSSPPQPARTDATTRREPLTATAFHVLGYFTNTLLADRRLRSQKTHDSYANRFAIPAREHRGRSPRCQENHRTSVSSM